MRQLAGEPSGVALVDGFESQDTLAVNYQDVSVNGMSVVTGEAFEGTHALRQIYTQGQVDAGWIIRVNNRLVSRPRLYALVPQVRSRVPGISTEDGKNTLQASLRRLVFSLRRPLLAGD